jgi:acyl-CoA thioester hydrolase
MSRIKIDLPESFAFSTSIPVQITDLNYGAHVGNDKVLSFLHEARVRYLHSLGYTEFNLEGIGLIMSDAALIFKNEMFYGDSLLISLQPTEFSRMGFELVYKIEKKSESQLLLVALAKTTMICFNYDLKKIVSLPDTARNKLTN